MSGKLTVVLLAAVVLVSMLAGTGCATDTGKANSLVQDASQASSAAQEKLTKVSELFMKAAEHMTLGETDE